MGKCFVVDGDGVRVDRADIRLAGLDAPEFNQPAIDARGREIEHGKYVKGRLIKRVGGRFVSADIEALDKYGRNIGTIGYTNAEDEWEDVGEWLVSQGLAWAMYDDRYKEAEAKAKAQRLGLWSYRKVHDPREWRAKERREKAREAAEREAEQSPRRPRAWLWWTAGALAVACVFAVLIQ